MTELARFSAAQKVFLFLVLCGSVAVAQDNSFPTWLKGTWDISPWIAGATGEEVTNSFTEAQLFSAGVFFGRVMTGEFGRSWRRASLELGFDMVPVFLQTGPQTIYGGGFDPVIIRFTSGHRFGPVIPYIELGGGGFATTSNFPAGNKTSDFNFSARGGGGIHLITKPRQSVDLACKWFHLSNANLASFNPEFNGIQFSLGYHWFK